MTVRRRCATGFSFFNNLGYEHELVATLTCQQQGIIKLFTDRSLDFGIGRKINTARRFIKHDDWTSAEESTGHRNKLPLSLGEVGAPSRDLRIQTNCRFGVDIGHCRGDGGCTIIPLNVDTVDRRCARGFA